MRNTKGKIEEMKKIKPASRLRFPEDEKRLPWLPLLLEAYSIIDKGVALAIREEEERRRAKPACRKGCSTCCSTHRDIPVYPLEMVGIYWFTIEKLQAPLRTTLRDQLMLHSKERPCPFLIDGACSVHPLRPVACRQFNVFDRPCDEGEDPYYTRRADVLSPIRNYADRAFTVMLPFYGITDEKMKAEVVKNGLIHAHARVLQELNWKELARRMDDFDSLPTPSSP